MPAKPSTVKALPSDELMRIMFEKSSARSFYLYGVKGSGKTSLAVNAALEIAGHIIKVTLNDGDMAAKYEGFYRPQKGDFEFVFGLFALAWTYNGGEGCPIIIDEVDHASGEVLSQLYGFLDDPSVAQLTLPNGQTIKPGPKFRCFGTSNEGPESIPEPLADRFEVKIRFDGPSSAMMKSLDTDVRKAAPTLMTPSRDGSVFSFRDLKHFCDHRKDVGDAVAAQAAFGERFSDVLTALNLS